MLLQAKSEGNLKAFILIDDSHAEISTFFPLINGSPYKTVRNYGTSIYISKP